MCPMGAGTLLNFKGTYYSKLLRIGFHQGHISFFTIAVEQAVGEDDVPFIA